MRLVTVARKPGTESSTTANAARHGCGALHVDACRVGLTGGTTRSHQAEYPRSEDGTEDRSASWARTGHRVEGIAAGRWPPNVVLCHRSGCVRMGHSTEDIWDCAAGCAVASLDDQSGRLTSGTGAVKRASSRDAQGNRGAAYGAESRKAGEVMICYGDSGGASRFFRQVRS